MYLGEAPFLPSILAPVLDYVQVFKKKYKSEDSNLICISYLIYVKNHLDLFKNNYKLHLIKNHQLI